MGMENDVTPFDDGMSVELFKFYKTHSLDFTIKIYIHSVGYIFIM